MSKIRTEKELFDCIHVQLHYIRNTQKSNLLKFNRIASNSEKCHCLEYEVEYKYMSRLAYMHLHREDVYSFAYISAHEIKKMACTDWHTQNMPYKLSVSVR